MAAIILDLDEIMLDDKLSLSSTEKSIYWSANDRMFCMLNPITFIVNSFTIEAIKYFIRAYQITDFTYNILSTITDGIEFLRPFNIEINSFTLRILSLNTPDNHQLIACANDEFNIKNTTIWITTNVSYEITQQFIDHLYRQGVIFVIVYHGNTKYYMRGKLVAINSSSKFNELLRQYYIDNYSENILLRNSTKSARNFSRSTHDQ